MAVGSISNADKIRNAATMFGTGSAQHRAATARFGGVKPLVRRAASAGKGTSGGSSQDRDRKGRFT